jgi:opacity protein-like surface antigen
MRAVILGLTGLLVAGDAVAADYLRGSSYEGSPAGYNWAGVYIGGQVGYGESNVDSSNAVKDMIANLLRLTTIEEEANVSTWPALPKRDARASTYGGFIGYNSQWGDVVLGLEANYNRTSLQTDSTDSIGRRYVISSGVQYDTFVDSAASMRITDYGTVRARFGYAWNWFLPYATVGLAVGRADLARSVTVTLDRTDLNTSPATPLGVIVYNDVKNQAGAFTLGYALGLGVDIGLLPGVFVRGEYEFVQLNTVQGMTAHISSFRAAAAVKF